MAIVMLMAIVFVEKRPSMCLSDQAAVCVCVALSSSEFELNGRCRKADLLLVFFGLAVLHVIGVYVCVLLNCCGSSTFEEINMITVLMSPLFVLCVCNFIVINRHCSNDYQIIISIVVLAAYSEVEQNSFV